MDTDLETEKGLWDCLILAWILTGSAAVLGGSAEKDTE